MRISLICALCLLPAAVVSAQPAPAAPPRWEVEAIGGFAAINPAGVNAVADYESTLVNYLRTAQIKQTHEGGLQTLDHAFPIGARVMRRLGRRWSVGTGFLMSTTEERSEARASYSYTVIDPRAQEYQRSFAETITVDPFMLRVREYHPHVLVRYDVTVWRRLRLGTSVDAGWVFADSRIERTRTTEGGFYTIKRDSAFELSGHGHGPATGASLLTRFDVTRRLGLLVEGGYAWHQVKELTGSTRTTAVIQDDEAAEVEFTQTTQVDGAWTGQTITRQMAPGTWEGTIPTAGGSGKLVKLDLSGWRLRVGVVLGL